MGSRNRAETAQPAEEDREFRRSARPRPRPLLPPRITPAPTHPPTAGIRSYRRYLPLLPHQRRPRPPASRPAPRRGALFCKIRARAHRGGDCMHRRFSSVPWPAQYNATHLTPRQSKMGATIVVVLKLCGGRGVYERLELTEFHDPRPRHRLPSTAVSAKNGRESKTQFQARCCD